MNEEQWPALPTQSDALPSSSLIDITKNFSVWDKELETPIQVENSVSQKNPNPKPKAETEAVIKDEDTEDTASKTGQTQKKKAKFMPLSRDLAEDKEDKEDKDKNVDSISKKSNTNPVAKDPVPKNNAKLKPQVEAEDLNKDKYTFQKPARGRKTHKFVPLTKNEEANDEDKRNTEKKAAPEIPDVPRKNNTKFVLNDCKVPKTKPPRGQGDGYYSGYYVRGKSSEKKVRVLVWVWA